VKIAVDASALGSGGGIGRYLQQVLSRAQGGPGPRHQWTLHVSSLQPGLDEMEQQPLGGAGGHARRIAALFGALPWRTWRAAPDLFWGPAHRLPLVLPAHVARVVTIHDLCWLRAPATMRAVTRGLDRLMMPASLQRADRVIAVSRATRDDLLAYFPALAGRLVHVPLAAASLPPPEPRERLPWTGRYVLCVGTLEPRKNHHGLVDAWASLPESIRGSTTLVLAGARGWGGIDPVALAQRCHGRLYWLEHVDDGLLATLYHHAECMALPSVYEGFGLPVLEALAHGTPVLVGDNSSLPEVAGPAGYRVDARDPAAIARGLETLLGDAALRGRLAGAARQHAALFSWESTARATLAVFDEALSARQERVGVRRGDPGAS
jgi:glycosyltransferase involved in cell wall biosynthesis